MATPNPSLIPSLPLLFLQIFDWEALVTLPPLQVVPELAWEELPASALPLVEIVQP